MAPTSPEKIKKHKTIQRLVVAVGIMIFIFMGIFPPWNAVVSPPLNNETVFVGYSFIGTPPHSPFGFDSLIIINYMRLLMQWGLLILIILGIYTYLNYRNSKSSS